MDILFSVYMVGAIAMFCFVILMALVGLGFGGTIPGIWFLKFLVIAALWPLMLLWGLTNVIQIKMRN